MKDFLELMEGEGLELSMTERAEHIQNLEQKIDKFITFMSFKPSKRKYILESASERARFLQEAETVSDFPNLFGTVLERSLLAKYQIQKPDWRTYVKVGAQNDFRSQNILGVFGLQGNLSVVKERGEYTAGKLVDGKVSCTLSKYGRLFPLSFEALINDDLGAFSDAADRLANAALRTEFYQATKLIAASTGPSTTLFGTALTHPLDATTVANKGTTALSAASLFATIVLMSNQRDYDGEPIMIDGYELVVPPNKWKEALEATSPAALIATGLSSTSTKERDTSANVTAMLNISIHVNPYLPIIDTTHGTTAWYVFARLSNGAAVQMNFLRGHENPELCMKLSDKQALGGGAISPMEGDFRNDSAYWRARHIMGGAVVDPRFAYAQDAAT